MAESAAGVVLGLWFVLQLFQGFSALASDVNSGIAFFAHVGGFLFGVAIAFVFLRGRRRPAEPRTCGLLSAVPDPVHPYPPACQPFTLSRQSARFLSSLRVSTTTVSGRRSVVLMR